VRTSDAVCFLGSVMQELGMISQEQHDASLERMQESPRLQGEILVELGATDPERVDVALRAQIERKIEHLFNLPPETTFAYYDGIDALATYGRAPTPIDLFPVLWRGVRKHPSLEHVDTTLRRIGAASLRAVGTAQFERFAFDTAEQQLLATLAERPLAVSDVTEALGESAGRVFVYFLMIMKQVELRDLHSQPFAAAQAVEATGDESAPSSGERIPPEPASSTPGRPSLGGAVPSAPASGQAFARLQLQRQTARSPVIIEEHAATAHDPRASTPALPKYDPVDTAAQTVASSGEHDALRTKILSRADLISSEDYFQMLGIARDAPIEAVQKAFIGLAKVWHPDRLPPALMDVKNACSKVFTHLTEAHTTLTDTAKRDQYAMLLKDGGATPDDQAKIQAIVEAATEFQKADFLLKRNASDAKVYELVARAVELDDQPDYVATLAWLDSQRPENKDKHGDKIAILDKCIERSPRCERAYFYRGMLHKRSGDANRALDDC
jgi:hypothetical protein